MTTLRTAAQQALEALYEETAWFGPTPKGAAAIAALKAALAQQDASVEPVPLKRGKTGRCTRKVCECEKEGLGPECIYLEPVIDGYPLWSGIPKAEQAEPVQEQDIEDAIEAAYWYFDARRSGLNEWASAPQSERDAFKAEARKLARGYFPTRQAQDTKREMLAVADAFIRGKRAALAQQDEPVEPVDAHTTTLRNLLECCLSWEPDACVLGNVTARQAVAALRAALAQEQAEPVQEPVAWAGCGECDCIFPCHDGKARCLRLPLQQAEPVAWLYEAGTDRTLHWQKPPLYGTPLYTDPPQRQPLTEEKIEEINRDLPLLHMQASKGSVAVVFARAIERAHGIGEKE